MSQSSDLANYEHKHEHKMIDNTQINYENKPVCIICLDESIDNMINFPTKYCKCDCKYHIHLQCLKKLKKQQCIMNCGTNMVFKKPLLKLTMADFGVKELAITISAQDRSARIISAQPPSRSEMLQINQRREEVQHLQTCCCKIMMIGFLIVTSSLVLWAILSYGF